MEVLSNSSSISFRLANNTHLLKLRRQLSQPITPSSFRFTNSTKRSNEDNSSNPKSCLPISSPSPSLTPTPPASQVPSFKRVRAAPRSAATPSSIASSGGIRHWMVIMEGPQQQEEEELLSKSRVIGYYVNTLQSVLGSEIEAQSRIYDASCDTHYGFCCDIDEETSRALARLPGVLSVRPDVDLDSVEKDYSCGKISGSSLLFPVGNSKHWVVRMDKPFVGAVTKVQMVDFYVKILTNVLGNKKDAQMCIYHISWQSKFGFCCILDEECAQELAGVPRVLSVVPDENVGSDNKDYGGDYLSKSINSPSSMATTEAIKIQTKKLFVTGLSFYTSEKTLRAAFEPFGELVEASIIMDKISKRSKGYAFVEYTTEEAASAAWKTMNGKVINGWIIAVGVAKSKPRYSKGIPSSLA
ncbi:Organelle RRM domain-containing protein 1, chloroplastic [Dionaea muscipula]